MTTVTDQFLPPQKPSEAVSGVTVRLAGDSGDGMQLLGTQLTNTSALAGNNSDSFGPKDLKLAKLDSNPLEDGTIDPYRSIKVSMSKMTLAAVEETGLSTKFAGRCKNFFAMGLVFWLYGRDVEPTLRFIEKKFAKKPEVAEANRRALKAGWNYGETTEDFASTYQIPKAELTPGTYRNVMGNQALAWGLVAASKLSKKELFLGSYPITPASDILHELSKHKNFGVRTFQAEDEIAAVCSAIGAAFGGAMALTTSSGPGIALKGEGLGLALMLELPMLVVDVQRGGPSTGLPTKTEQSDLMMMMYGRNGESPLPIVAARSPSDCFMTAIEAWRVAVKFMTPVIIMSDGYIANGAEPWRIPDVADLPAIEVNHPAGAVEGEAFLPYKRNKDLARPWAVPGTPGLMHRVGGLEKQDETGNVSYDPDNHQKMVQTRAEKVARVADFVDPIEVEGADSGTLLISWGGTYGACHTAMKQSVADGLSVGHVHCRWISPFPANLGAVIAKYDRVLVAELNSGQLLTLLKSTYLVDAKGLNKVKGKPFQVSEVVDALKAISK